MKQGLDRRTDRLYEAEMKIFRFKQAVVLLWPVRRRPAGDGHWIWRRVQIIVFSGSV